MKNWIILIIVLVVICIIGYLNRENYDTCVKIKTAECEDNGYLNCEVKAKDFCENDRR